MQPAADIGRVVLPNARSLHRRIHDLDPQETFTGSAFERLVSEQSSRAQE
jgi:hypothetical protein